MKRRKCNWRLVADKLILRNLKGFVEKSWASDQAVTEPDDGATTDAIEPKPVRWRPPAWLDAPEGPDALSATAKTRKSCRVCGRRHLARSTPLGGAGSCLRVAGFASRRVLAPRSVQEFITLARTLAAFPASRP